MKVVLPITLLVAALLAGCSRHETSWPPASEPAACAGSQLKGIDVSDGNGTIDWSSVQGAGVSFAYIKATQGTYFVAGTFAENWAGSHAAGVARGAYHFFDPTEDGAAQAQAFLAAMGTLHPGDLPPALSFGCPDGDAACLGFPGGSGTASAVEIAARASAFLAAVQAATGRTPVVFSNGTYFSGNQVDDSGFSSNTLWLQSLNTTCPVVPQAWHVAPLWENSDSGTIPGITGAVDTDIFFGTPADLVSFAGGTVAAPTPVASATPTATPGSGYTPPASLAAACSGPTVTGIDVSGGQGALNWAQVAGAGIGFAYIKASQGTYFLDDQFAANWAGAKANGIARGAYHFFDPTDDGATQANDFLGQMGTLLPGDLPPALDIECPDSDPTCLGFSGGSGDASPPPSTPRQKRSSTPFRPPPDGSRWSIPSAATSAAMASTPPPWAGTGCGWRVTSTAPR